MGGHLHVDLHCRDALVRVLTWFAAVAAADDPKAATGHPAFRDDDVDLLGVMGRSQLFRNLQTWLGVSQPALDAVMNFYTPTGEVKPEHLAPMMAVLHVALDVGGLPDWTQAGLHARVLAKNMACLAVATDREAELCTKAEEHLVRQFVKASGELQGQLAATQERDDARATDYFQPIDPSETTLLRIMKDLVSSGLRVLMLRRPSATLVVTARLTELVNSCARHPDTVVGGEPLAARLAEGLADLASTVRGLEERVKHAVAMATGAEQIAEATDRALLLAMKKMPRAPKPTATGGKDLDKVTAKLSLRAAEHEDRMSAEIRRLDARLRAAEDAAARAAAEVAGLRALLDAQSVSDAVSDAVSHAVSHAVADVRAETLAVARDAVAAEARVACDATVRPVARTLTRRLEALESRVGWVTRQVHADFCGRWNALSAQWAGMQQPAVE